MTRRKVLPDEVSPDTVCQNWPNDKILMNGFFVFQTIFAKKKKGKYQGDKFSFHFEETLTLAKTESPEN